MEHVHGLLLNYVERLHPRVLLLTVLNLKLLGPYLVVLSLAHRCRFRPLLLCESLQRHLVDVLLLSQKQFFELRQRNLPGTCQINPSDDSVDGVRNF